MKKKEKKLTDPARIAIAAVNAENERDSKAVKEDEGKIINHSTPKKPRGKKRDVPTILVVDEVKTLGTGELWPITNRFLTNMAQDLIEWADKDTSLIFRSFLNNRKISRNHFYRWRDKEPLLAEAHEYALEKIAERRELGGLTKSLDTGMVMYSMPMYCKEWKDSAEWRSKLKSGDLDAGGTKIVVIEKFKEE